MLLKNPLDLISGIIQQYSLRFRPRTARYNGTGKKVLTFEAQFICFWFDISKFLISLLCLTELSYQATKLYYETITKSKL